MIALLALVISIDLPQTIDSLEAELDREICLSTILELNRCYVQQEEYSRAIQHLQSYEHAVSWDDQAALHVLVGDNLLYVGSLIAAREEYLTVVSRYTKSDAANDALDRLYLLETGRIDTIALKRLGYALSRMYTRQWTVAQDSLRQLLRTYVGSQAYYYLALVYKETGDIPLALGTLDALMRDFPKDNNLRVPLLKAELNILSNHVENARTLLEDFFIEHPQSIYTVKARALLNSIPQSNP
jgi:tetratricopeptide (TPR) repeat protein